MDEKKEPYKKSKSGRFQISLFKFERVLKERNEEKETKNTEIILENVRVCVQYSIFSKSYNRWQRQQIWCSPEELRDLCNAVSGLTE